MYELLLRYANPVVLLFGSFGFGYSSVVIHALLIRRLRLQHPELWKSLGSPTFWPARNQSAMESYFSSRDAVQVCDSTLDALLFGRRLVGAVAAGLALLFIVSLVALSWPAA